MTEAQLKQIITRLNIKLVSFKWEGSFDDVFMIIAQMELALKHPQNRGRPARHARELLRQWKAALVEEEPELEEFFFGKKR